MIRTYTGKELETIVVKSFELGLIAASDAVDEGYELNDINKAAITAALVARLQTKLDELGL